MSLSDDIRNLTRIPLFAEFEPEALRLIAFAGETRILRAGDVLFRRGEVSDCGYIVLTGSIALDAAGDGSPAVQIVGPNALIGEIALIARRNGRRLRSRANPRRFSKSRARSSIACSRNFRSAQIVCAWRSKPGSSISRENWKSCAAVPSNRSPD